MQITLEFPDSDNFTEEEIQDLLTFTPKSGAEVVAAGLTGGWEHKDINDPVAWVEEQRRKQRERGNGHCRNDHICGFAPKSSTCNSWYWAMTAPTLGITSIIWMEVIGGGQNNAERLSHFHSADAYPFAHFDTNICPLNLSAHGTPRAIKVSLYITKAREFGERIAMRFMLWIIFVLVFVAVSTALAQATPSITTFTSDRASITPDEAESGAAYVNLAWITSGMRPDDTVHLQVYVLGQWHDILPGALTNTGTLKWAVPHTLDFLPPTFRLAVRDRNGQQVTYADLVIPYAEVNAILPPEITAFTTTLTSVTDAQLLQADFVVPVAWEVKGRPPRANLLFEQVMDEGKVVSVELPRPFRWIRSKGTGSVRPLLDGSSLLLRARLANIDTGEVYAEKTLTLAVNVQPSGDGGTSGGQRPTITSATASSYTPKRGDRVTLKWDTSSASGVWISVYDIDYFPRGGVPDRTIHRYDNLPGSGSLDIPIAADYAGGGWQIHFGALKEGVQGYDGKRIDLIFADVKQPILLNIKTFTITPQPVKRGEKITVTWDTYVTTRTSENGVVSYQKPVSGYDDKLFLEVTGISPMAATPDSPHNQRFSNLPKSGSRTITIGDYDPLYHGFTVVLGMVVDGTPITYDNLFVELVPPPNYATTTAVDAAYQPFNGGFMIWNGVSGEVRVYYGSSGGQVEVYPLSAYESLADNPVSDNAPQGYFKPVNAFGRIWGNHQNVRDTLGWAVTPEQGYSMSIVTRTDTPNAVTITLPNFVKVFQLGSSWNY